MNKKKKRIGILFFFLLFLLLGLYVYMRCYEIQGLNSYKENSSRELEKIIKQKTSFDYSTEGATLFGIYDSSNSLQYLKVDILGEMGRKIHEYTFADESIIYSYIEIYYTEPFYINPQKIKINKVNYRNYILYGGKIYSYSMDDNYVIESKELQEEVITNMQNYILDIEEMEE